MFESDAEQSSPLYSQSSKVRLSGGEGQGGHEGQQRQEGQEGQEYREKLTIILSIKVTEMMRKIKLLTDGFPLGEF